MLVKTMDFMLKSIFMDYGKCTISKTLRFFSMFEYLALCQLPEADENPEFLFSVAGFQKLFPWERIRAAKAS